MTGTKASGADQAAVPASPPADWSDDRPMFTNDSAPSQAELQEARDLNRELNRR